MKDINISGYHNFTEPPAGASAWISLAGHLTGRGESYYHSLPDYCCPHIITKGRGTVETVYGKIEVKPGDMFTLWPGVEIKYFENRHDPWEFYYFHLEGEKKTEFMNACGFSQKKFYFRPEHTEKAINIFKSLYRCARLPSPGSVYQMLSLLYLLPACCHEQTLYEQEPKSDIVAKATTLIKTRLAINVSEICSELQVSRSTLFRVFRERLNITPVQYISRERLRKARQLLNEPNRNIADVAFMSGFTNEKYFFRRFREIEKMTPGEYRQKKLASS
jgi:AraC-like DNA-binding protein